MTTRESYKKTVYLPWRTAITCLGKLPIKYTTNAKYISVEGIILLNEPSSNFQLIDAANELKHKHFRLC